jgi:hypothetical protein
VFLVNVLLCALLIVVAVMSILAIRPIRGAGSFLGAVLTTLGVGAWLSP